MRTGRPFSPEAMWAELVIDHGSEVPEVFSERRQVEFDGSEHPFESINELAWKHPPRWLDRQLAKLTGRDLRLHVAGLKVFAGDTLVLTVGADTWVEPGADITISRRGIQLSVTPR